MAVSFDQGTAAIDNGGSSPTATWTPTVGSGANQALIVWANLSNASAITVDPIRVTCDGKRMTLIPNTDTLNQSGVATVFRTLGFIITGLAAGSHTVVCNQGGNINSCFIVLGGASFFGVHPVYPIRQASSLFSYQTSTTSPSLVIPCVVGDATCDAVADFSFAPSAPTKTVINIKDGMGMSYALAAATSETHGWTMGGSTNCTQSGAILRAFTNGGGYPGAAPFVK